VPPGSRGVYTDTLRVSIDSCGLTYDIPVRIRLVETIVIGYTTELEKFGFVTVGTSLTHTFVIRNESRRVTDSAYFEKLPTVSAPWTLSLTRPASLPTMLAPGDSIVFDLTFAPVSGRYFEQTITWETVQRSYSCATTVIFKPNGFGSNSSVTPSTAEIAFGTVYQCQSPRDSVWIRNLGTAPAIITAPGSVTGTDPTAFRIVNEPAVNTTLALGDSVLYVIQYVPDPALTTTSVRTALLVVAFKDDTARTLSVVLSATQKRAALQILDAVPIVVNSVPVNGSQAVQLGVQNTLDTTICITDVRTTNENDVRPDLRFFDIPKGQQRAFQFTILPKSLSTINDTATIYIGCPCTDSIKIRIIANPINTSLLFTPRQVTFDTVDVCERPQPVAISIKNLDVSSTASIDTVFLQGPDAEYFRLNLPLWTTYPAPVGANSTLGSAIVVTYEGSGKLPGQKNARIIVRYRLNNVVIDDTIPVGAYRYVPIVPSLPSLDFGTVKQGETVTLPLTLTNTFNRQLVVTFGVGPVLLPLVRVAPVITAVAGGRSESVSVDFTGAVSGT
ncbi:MAG: choice-of-anchor D domain-containing protein, partial [Candidatus Kapaibacterium sp.]